MPRPPAPSEQAACRCSAGRAAPPPSGGRLTGVKSGSTSGWAVAGGEDVDLDGVGDVVVGAPHYGGVAGSSLGRAVVLSGLNGSLLAQAFGSSPGDQLGYSVAALGDANGDGHGEWAVGVPFRDALWDADLGLAVVFSGATGESLGEIGGNLALPANSRLGTAIANVGDITGDGRDDLAVAAPLAGDGLGADSRGWGGGGGPRGWVRPALGGVRRRSGPSLRERAGRWSRRRRRRSSRRRRRRARDRHAGPRRQRPHPLGNGWARAPHRARERAGPGARHLGGPGRRRCPCRRVGRRALLRWARGWGRLARLAGWTAEGGVDRDWGVA